MNTYKITFNEQLENRIGKNNFIEVAENPQKAIKNLMDKLGYKVKISRIHSYSYPVREADIMTQLVVEGKELTYIYSAYYIIRTMIKLSV
ncbi:MAG: hypothetical protein IJZ79_03335 [Bacilli bacterium]|nr:hypothetical protein [Bacilli bacterium]MBQ8218761.1 hypothetical protein [Bacilli bacterium]